MKKRNINIVLHYYHIVKQHQSIYNCYIQINLLGILKTDSENK